MKDKKANRIMVMANIFILINNVSRFVAYFLGRC